MQVSSSTHHTMTTAYHGSLWQALVCRAVPCHVMSCHFLPQCVMQCCCAMHAVLRYAVLCTLYCASALHTVPCYVTLCCPVHSTSVSEATKQLTVGPGTGMATSLSSLPGRRKAGSSTLGRFVAATIDNRPPSPVHMHVVCELLCCGSSDSITLTDVSC